MQVAFQLRSWRKFIKLHKLYERRACLNIFKTPRIFTTILSSFQGWRLQTHCLASSLRVCLSFPPLRPPRVAHIGLIITAISTSTAIPHRSIVMYPITIPNTTNPPLPRRILPTQTPIPPRSLSRRSPMRELSIFPQTTTWRLPPVLNTHRSLSR